LTPELLKPAKIGFSGVTVHPLLVLAEAGDAIDRQGSGGLAAAGGNPLLGGHEWNSF
jgi:hypothetical protein